MRLPSKKQWVQIFRVLTKKERIAFLVFLGLFFVSSLSLLIIFYTKNTEIRPKVGGKYTEGMVGSPRFINPIYAQNSDVDRALVELIFSGLMQYSDDGKIIPDLAKTIEIKEGGEVYDVYLKENLSWHDGKPVTTDDVIFTFKTVQNPDYKSPLRGNYLGIEVEKISDLAVRFKLKNPYPGFEERLTLKIIPKHIWQDISPQNFLLSNYNLRPLGSGPYRFKKFEQDNSNAIVSLQLVRFKESHLSEIIFRFFKTEKELIEAAKGRNLDGFSVDLPEYYQFFKKGSWQELSLTLPRYFAIFFNPDKSRFLAKGEIRKALNYGIDKKEMVDTVLFNRAMVVDSPILPEVFGFNLPSKIYEFDQEKAKDLLEKAGLTQKDGKWFEITKGGVVEFKSYLEEGSRSKEVTQLQTCLAKYPEIYPEGKISGYFGSQTKEAIIRFQEKYAEEILKPWGFKKGTGIVSKTTRAKLNEICSEPAKETPLKFSLITVEDPILIEVADLLKSQWEKIGVELEIKTYSPSQIEQEIIKPRNYEMLLFGEVLEIIPDPYPFWHSSQIKDPGLNLAKYENKKVDKLLEAARTILDPELRAQKYQEFQDILIEDAPCLFLYSPEYVYYVSPKIKGIDTKIIADPSKRFSNIENWYIKTKRAWK